MTKYSIITFYCLLGLQEALAQTFTHIPADVGSAMARSVMADLDNDGFPELIQAGRDATITFVFKTYKNTGTGFNAGVEYPSLAVGIGTPTSLDAGDMNRDGFIDIFQTHSGAAPELILNASPGLTNLTGTQLDAAGPVSIADLEGDGDLDVLSTSSSGIIINRLKSGGYDFSQRLSTGFSTAGAHWANLDSDTPLEVIVSEVNGTNAVHKFDGTRLVNQGGIAYSGVLTKAAFADFDSDGDIDFVGFHTGEPKLFKNTNGVFVASSVGLAWGNTIVCGDLNNDGNTDIVISGVPDPAVSMDYVVAYINQGSGTFVALPNITSAAFSSALSLADFDGDGDLDVEGGQSMYRNNIATPNLAPTVPTGTTEIVSGKSVHLSWNAASDATTPSISLSYNIHLRRADGTIVVPSHSLSSGKRQIFRIGNAWLNEFFDISCLQEGQYFWKVQAIDASHRGGAFTTERSFSITSPPPAAPLNLTAVAKSDTTIQLNWQDQSTTEDGFIIFRQQANYVDPTFYAIDTVAADATQYLDMHGLQAGTGYVYRVAASNCAYPDEIYAELQGQTFPRVFLNENWLDLGTAEGIMSLLGDFDNDGDLDLLASHSGQSTTKLYLFDGSGFVLSPVQLPIMAHGAQWIDYNSDGFLDLLLYPSFGFQMRLFKNEGGTALTEVVNAGLPPTVFWQAGISAGDYDLDGDEDMIVQAGAVIHVYENVGGRFSRNSAISLTGNLRGQGSLADFDLDGDLDILASQEISCSSSILAVFENKGDKTFSILTYPTLAGLGKDHLNYAGDFEWGDFDNDGYPDALLAGKDQCINSTGINRVYRNNGDKTFSPFASFPGKSQDASVQWGDYDNDGDLDIFNYGYPASGAGNTHTKVYRNNGSTFVDSGIDYLLAAPFQGGDGSAERGDIDNDGDLDYVIFGPVPGFSGEKMYAFRNTLAEDWGIPNHKPTAPGSPASSFNPDTGAVTLTWDKSVDDETPQDGLTYNIWVVDESDNLLVNSYSQADGTRKLVGAGNAASRNTWQLKNLAAGNYRWAVQAIDKGFAGSEFSSEGEFTIPEIEEVTGLADAASVHVFPNPVTNTLTVQCSTQSVQAELSSVQGVSLLSIQVAESATIDLSHLPTGLYVLRLTGEDGSKKAIKVLKQHP